MSGLPSVGRLVDVDEKKLECTHQWRFSGKGAITVTGHSTQVFPQGILSDVEAYQRPG
ncbi:hypothetical protein HUO13_15445 [Saccharopolyspora erythraea]|uniref:hypothetical protein n=1 Tax=Saccharopolyspora erythraea TaxID=1836 RepID=UPI001BADA50F|nr:hypothetical protein [Saccharopolyspora erythraea]QUH02009.1 hypothetical protein HUO13_15445 [Saccharopolyspora erythraea]